MDEAEDIEEDNDDLEIRKNQNLNEDAEYSGSKQDLEEMLLTAQRYLNIFHQIHIFNDKKKAEFDQSLLEMPPKIRRILLNLPGGKVLIEHIEDCEIKKGLREKRTDLDDEDPFADAGDGNSATGNGAALTKEFADTMAEALKSYNQTLLQMNQKVQQNQIAESDKSSKDETKILAEVLRQNNKQQMEMMKSFGTMLTQTILNSEKEMFAMLDKKIQKQNSLPEESVTTGPQQDNRRKNDNGKNDVKKQSPSDAQSDKTQPGKKDDKKDTSQKSGKDTAQATGKNSVSKDARSPQNAPAADKGTLKTAAAAASSVASTTSSSLSDDEISKLLIADSAAKTSADEKPFASVQNDNASGKNKKTLASFGSAMQKIKDAISQKADPSPKQVSLDASEDDLTASFAGAFGAAKKIGGGKASFDDKLSDDNVPPAKTAEGMSSAEDDEWEYVDEDGNPVDPSEWEYVDEDGNPVDPSEWEYVDENGNPVNPEEAEKTPETDNEKKKS